jgi:hypothetical protein
MSQFKGIRHSLSAQSKEMGYRRTSAFISTGLTSSPWWLRKSLPAIFRLECCPGQRVAVALDTDAGNELAYLAAGQAEPLGHGPPAQRLPGCN